MRQMPNARRGILVGLMTVCGLFNAAAQQPPGPELRPTQTDVPDATNPRFAHIASANAKANLPENGARPGSAEQGNPLWSIPPSSLTATRERPIFSPTRRPSPAVVKPTATRSPSAAEPLLTLVGAIAGENNEGIAIFLDGTTKGVIRLKTGESHAGWTLQAVKAREVILQKEQRTAILMLPNPLAKSFGP